MRRGSWLQPPLTSRAAADDRVGGAPLKIECASPIAESSPAPENFFSKAPSTERLPPFWGRNRFWTGFWERGHEQFSESKSPPTGGVASAAHIQARLRDAVP